MLLRAFTIGQLDNPKTAEAITNALTNIDLELTKQFITNNFMDLSKDYNNLSAAELDGEVLEDEDDANDDSDF